MPGDAALILAYQDPAIVVALSVLSGPMLPPCLVATGEAGVIPVGQINERVFFMIVWGLLRSFGVLVLGGAIGAVIQGETVGCRPSVSNQNFSNYPRFEGLEASFSANALVDIREKYRQKVVWAIAGIAAWINE